jgi:hypothetical protein
MVTMSGKSDELTSELAQNIFTAFWVKAQLYGGNILTTSAYVDKNKNT